MSTTRDGTAWPAVAAALVLLPTGFGVFASRYGKFVVWED